MNDKPQLTTISPNLESRYNVKYIKDPIYGFISLTKTLDGSETSEQDIVDTVWIQRLKRIKQTQCCHQVYPGMEHTRFPHVLGVMNLAGEFARFWYERFWHENNRDGKPIIKNLPSINYIEEVFRLAGLFHDVGHGPFSHSLDTGYKKFSEDVGKSFTHEHVSQYIVVNEFSDTIKQIRRSPHGYFKKDEVIDPKVIAWLIRQKSGKIPGDKPSNTWIHALRWIISGIYDADSLDYLVRDSYYAGSYAYGLPDVQRLKVTTFLTNDGLLIYDKSKSAVENLLFSRLRMYEICYFHKTVRAFEIRVEKIMADTLKTLNFVHPDTNKEDFLTKFFDFDEYSLFENAKIWSKQSADADKCKLGHEWLNIYNRSPSLKVAMSKPIRIYDKVQKRFNEALPQLFRDDFNKVFTSFKSKPDPELRKSGFSETNIKRFKNINHKEINDALILDSPSLAGRKIDVALKTEHPIRVYYPDTGIRKIETFEECIKKFPLKMQLFRVYTTLEYLDIVKILSEQAYKNFEEEESEGSSQDRVKSGTEIQDTSY